VVHLSVIGTGYLGATHAACLASWGHDVVGLDSDPVRLGPLREGRAPFHEPGLDDLLAAGVREGRLRFTDDPAELAGCEAHFLCVGTPPRENGSADLSALWEAADAVAPHLRPGALVIGKSTVPVGTARPLRDRLADAAGHPVAVAWNPEFLREGQAVHDSLHPARLVFGVDRPEDEPALRRIYAPCITEGVPAVVTGLETAELAKVSANLMLAARVSMVNVLAEVCEASGADMHDLTRILGLDSRIGADFLVPGIGYGGGCLPKDSRAFGHRAADLGVAHARDLVDQLDRINLHQRERTTAAALRMLDHAGVRPDGARVAVLGAAFKADSDDVRDSPALDIARRVRREVGEVTVYDPCAGPNAAREAPELAVSGSVGGACCDADLVMVLTEWSEFRDLDPDALAVLVRNPMAIDGRQVLDTGKWQQAGWDVLTLGSGRRHL
jgi:UDPglucose 6-dehydrogenase